MSSRRPAFASKNFKLKMLKFRGILHMLCCIDRLAFRNIGILFSFLSEMSRRIVSERGRPVSKAFRALFCIPARAGVIRSESRLRRGVKRSAKRSVKRGALCAANSRDSNSRSSLKKNQHPWRM